MRLQSCANISTDVNVSIRPCGRRSMRGETFSSGVVDKVKELLAVHSAHYPPKAVQGDSPGPCRSRGCLSPFGFNHRN